MNPARLDDFIRWQRAGRPDPAWWKALSSDEREEVAHAGDVVFAERVAQIVEAASVLLTGVTVAVDDKPRDPVTVVEVEGEDYEIEPDEIEALTALVDVASRIGGSNGTA